MATTTTWRTRPFDRERVESLARAAGVHPLVAHLLLNRRVADAGQARSFLEGNLKTLHDPELLPGAPEAADRIARAVRDRRKIVVYGDYDADGVCGTSLLWECLRLAGADDAGYYIPHRVDEGYGLNAEALRRLAAEGAAVVVTVDCGISAVAEAQLARDLGVELIVTDHHTPGDALPAAAAIVHPGVRGPGGEAYPFEGICGCGVAFKLAWQVAKGFGDGKKASPHLREYLRRSLALVALATIADMVPLADENRVFVREGLKLLAEAPSAGLKALLRVAGHAPGKPVNGGFVGFQIAPRINAAGRMECARTAVELLTTTDEIAAGRLAEELDACNRRRRDLEQTIVAEARRIVDDRGGVGEFGALVVGSPGWHPGVIGIVAGRLAELYHRPSIVVAQRDGVGQGSARSVEGFDLYEAIKACSAGLIGFGGHRAAAGLRVADAEFVGFAERFDAYCRGSLAPELRQKSLVIDAEVPLGVLTPAVVDQLAKLEPYGIGNPRPVLRADDLRVVGDPRRVGAGQEHLQLRLAQGDVVLKAIAWRMAERLAHLKAGSLASVAFQPTINEWNGRREVQLEIRDVHDAEDRGHARSA